MNFQTRSSAGTNHAAHKSNFCLDGTRGKFYPFYGIFYEPS